MTFTPEVMPLAKPVRPAAIVAMADTCAVRSPRLPVGPFHSRRKGFDAHARRRHRLYRLRGTSGARTVDLGPVEDKRRGAGHVIATMRVGGDIGAAGLFKVL